MRTTMAGQRGASVLAALVIAAVLASVGLLIQDTSPLAFVEPLSQGAQAASATAAPSPTLKQVQTTEKCAAGYDYLVDATGKLSRIEPPVCTITGVRTNVNGRPYPPVTKAIDLWGKDGGRCVPVNGQTGTVPANDWKCITRWCLKDEKSSQINCENFFYNDKGSAVSEGKPTPSATPGTSGSTDPKTLADQIAKGSITPEDASKLLQGDPNGSKLLNDALTQKKEDVQKQIGDLTNDYAANLKLLQQSGCDVNPASSLSCAQIQADQSNIESKIEDLNNQYQNLDKAKVVLTPPDPTDPGTADPAGGKPCPSGYIGTQPNCTRYSPNTFGPGPGQQNTNAACQACQAGNQNACMQCAQSQGNGMRPPTQGQGGSGSNGNQQQQCQPRYVCNGNALVYLPCANLNQNGAQTVQQCPTGYQCQSNGSSNSSCQLQSPYGLCSDGKTSRPSQPQQQPPANTCTVGTWQDSPAGCQTNWQCKSGSGAGPTAQLTCQPQAATKGMTITLSYACAGGATSASSTGFTLASTALIGSATTLAERPATGNTVTYGITCTDNSVSPNATASAQCSIQLGNTSIVLVATPEKVQKSEADDVKRQATIGWVTTGMQSCVISSPQYASWTAAQAGNTSVAGAVVSPALSADTDFMLTCQTLGGTTATSSVTVLAL